MTHTPTDTSHDRQWMRDRIKRHVSEIVRLSFPASMMRLGVMMLGIVDTAMVGHYATEHLAWLNLANQSVIMFTLVVGFGLVHGVMVVSALAFGQNDYEGCGRVWRRSLPFSFILGLIIVGISYPSDIWLSLLGQTPEKAKQSGDLIRILSYGIPGHLLFACCTMFLEGVKRADVGFKLMIWANIVNIIFNYALVYGNWGMPEMGSAGSAWASTIVRWAMAVMAVGYVWYSPTLKKFKVRNPNKESWRSWSEQRHIGYATAVSLAAEVAAFSALAIFAGWIGTITLAAQGIIHQLLSIPYMMALGIGVAGSVRTGIAFSRHDIFDVRIGGFTGLVIGTLMLMFFAFMMYMVASSVLFVFTNDVMVIDTIMPIMLIIVVMMVFDGQQMILGMTIRGMKEKWWPTAIQAFSYLGLMIPLCYYLAIILGMGLWGLIMGTLVASIVSTLLQLWFFHWLTSARE